MRLLLSSGLGVLLLLHSGCGNDFKAGKDDPKGGDAGEGGEGNAGSGPGGEAGGGTGGGTGGSMGGTAGAMGGSAGSGKGGTSGTAGTSTGGAGGDAGAPSCTLADSWQTIGDFQLVAGQHSNPGTIVAAPPNRLYAAGVARSGTFQWHVRRSNDGGGSWDPVDEEGMEGGASDVVVDSTGRVFVAGNTSAGRIVRRSTDNGDSWMTVDTIPGGTGNDPCSSGSLATTANAIYFSASCDSMGVVVRRSTNGGDSWSGVDSFQYTTTAQTRMQTLGVDATGQAYVGGTGAQPMDGSSHWLIRRGTGMGTWTTVDDYQLAAANHANAANFFGSADAIYAAGSANDADGASHWIIRRASNDDPSNFATVDDVAPAQNLEQLAANAVFQASSGLFVAVGSSKVGDGPARVVYRRSSDGGQTWSPAGDYQYVTGADSSPAGTITEDASGHLYTMVRGVDADGFAHWIFRRLLCN